MDTKATPSPTQKKKKKTSKTDNSPSTDSVSPITPRKSTNTQNSSTQNGTPKTANVTPTKKKVTKKKKSTENNSNNKNDDKINNNNNNNSEGANILPTLENSVSQETRNRFEEVIKNPKYTLLDLQGAPITFEDVKSDDIELWLFQTPKNVFFSHSSAFSIILTTY
jgi:hypothetical protein